MVSDIRIDKPSAGTYFGSFDGIRALCIVLTLLAHTPGYNGPINGALGVDVFFALSGFLITALLIFENQSRGQTCLLCFYIRRAFRIIPVYFFVIALYGFTAYLMFQRGKTQDWLNFTATFPWLITFNREYAPMEVGNLLGHAWTLGIEEKFYIFLPLIFVLISKKWVAGPILLTVALMLAPFLGPHELRGYGGLFFGTISSVLVWRSAEVRNILRRIPDWLLLTLTLAAMIVCTATGEPKSFLAVSLLSALLVSRLALGGGTLSHFLALPPFQYVGRLTYCIYLLHRLVGHTVDVIFTKTGIDSNAWIHFAMVYALSVMAAAFVNRFFEMPLINIGRKFSERQKARRDSASLELMSVGKG